MDAFRTTRGLFISTISALLAACSSGGNFVSGALTRPSAGQWRIGSTEGFTDCEGVTVLYLRLPTGAGRRSAYGAQLLVSETRAPGETCGISPKTPLPLAMRVAINRLTHRPRGGVGTASVQMTSGMLLLDEYPSDSRQSVKGLSGIASFRVDTNYTRQLESLGFPVSVQQALRLAVANVTVEDVKNIARVFPDADLADIRGFRWFGLSSSDAFAFHRAMPSLKARDMVRLAGMGVTPAYITHLRESGVKNPTVIDVMSARVADVKRDNS
jgi:hypothetical protein